MERIDWVELMESGPRSQKLRGKSLFHSNQLLARWAPQLMEWKERGWEWVEWIGWLWAAAAARQPANEGDEPHPKTNQIQLK